MGDAAALGAVFLPMMFRYVSVSGVLLCVLSSAIGLFA